MGMSPGGLIPGGPVAVTLDPDECVLAVRDGQRVCIRLHECPARIERINQAFDALRSAVIRAGGKPNKGTPADKRLGRNRPAPVKATPKPRPMRKGKP